jgi:hypothetical protein
MTDATDEIVAEADSARRAEERFTLTLASLADAERPAATRGLTGIGRHLIQSRGLAATQRRYAGLLTLEPHFPEAGDYGQLIAPCSLLLEEETAKGLAEPARALGAHLCEALASRDGETRHVELLKKWVSGQLPTTLGTIATILLALRRGLERADEPISTFLARRFRPDYIERIRTNSLAKLLDRIRNEFRNPACHGMRTFQRSEYGAFLHLLLGRERILRWDIEGPEADAGERGCALVHQLTATSAPGAVDDVSTGEAAPGALTIRVEPHEARFSSALRDIGVTAPLTEARIGQVIRLRLLASEDCHVVLIALGTSGATSVLLPNAWHPSAARLERGKVSFFPVLERPDFVFRVGGPPGRERVSAIASREQLGIALAPPEGELFRRLPEAGLEEILGILSARPQPTWALGHAEFEIRP